MPTASKQQRSPDVGFIDRSKYYAQLKARGCFTLILAY